MKKLSRFIVPCLLLFVLAAAGCSKRSREAKFLQRADKYFAAGDYDSAELEYINALRINHQSARAYGRLGIISFEQGRLQRSYSLLLKACQLETNNIDFRLELGLFDLSAGRREKAREEAMFVLSHRPDDPQAPGLLADAAETSRQMDQVKAFLQKLNVPPARSAPIETAIGEMDLRERNQTEALAALQRAKTADPKYEPMYDALANYYWSEKDLKRADEAFKASIETAPPRSVRRLKYAQFKIQNGDIPGARLILEESIKKAPDYMPAMTTLAGVDVAEKKFDSANEWLGKVLARDPDNYEALLMSGRLGLMVNEPDKAVAQFEKMARAYPKTPQVMYQLGLAYNAAGDTTKAFATLNQIVNQNTNFYQAILALAQMKVAKGDLNSAVVSLQQILQQKPKMPEAQLMLADTYRLQGDLEASAKVYRQVEQEFPDNAQTPVLLGVVLMRQQKWPEARQEFNRSLALAPDYFSALEGLTDLDLQERKFSDARDRVEREMQKNPKDPQPTLLLAKINVLDNKVPEAVAALQKAIDAHPEFLQGSFTLAEVYADSGQNQKAMDTIRGIVSKHPDQIGSWLLLGMIGDKIKDYKVSVEGYQKVIELDPKRSVALNNLAVLYSEHGELDKGYDMARRARELLPYEGSTADTLGWIVYKKGDYAQAATLLRESVTQQPNAPDVQLHFGLASYMTGDEENARPALQYAVKVLTQAKLQIEGQDVAQQRLATLAIDPRTAGPEAKAALEKQVAAQPDDPVALNKLAFMYVRDGAADKAVSAYESVLKANPKNVPAMVQLSRLYAAQPNQTDKALALAKEAYKQSPTMSGVAQTFGHMSLVSGDYKLALNLLTDADRQKPGDPDLLYDLAQAAYGEGRVVDAQSYLQTALQSGSNFARAAEAKHFLDLVMLSSDPARATAGASTVDETLKSNPKSGPALMAMGLIDEQKSDFSGAIENYDKVLDLYPDFSPARRRLAILYANQPGVDDKKGYDVAVKAYLAYPDDADVSRALGILLYRQGEFTKSSQRLKDVLAKKNNDALVNYYLGMDQYQLKQRAESKKNLQRAVELKLPEKQAAEAQRVLVELK
ncbi:MAG TPA: tetratricopeptide repeat protein [Verrucomicrobiae bacterium]|nr:tetratricopeptide repeat protein [Verrucomicrobiae bacterium]